MSTRPYRTAGWAAILSGIVALLAMATLILFFWLEAPSDGASTAHEHHSNAGTSGRTGMVGNLIVE